VGEEDEVATAGGGIVEKLEKGRSSVHRVVGRPDVTRAFFFNEQKERLPASAGMGRLETATPAAGH